MIRIGIIGCGRITERFVHDMKYNKRAVISGVYNPHPGSAEAFAGKHGISFWTQDIDGLFDRSDAVYIAAPHREHVSYTRLALDRGKHVLCEKPLCFSEKEAAELYEHARSKGLVLLEAVKTAFCPGFQKLCETVLSGRIGKVTDIEAAFSKLTPVNTREFEDRQYGGSFTELGTYVLLPVLRFFGTQYEELRFDSVNVPNGTDGYTKTTLVYKDGVTATCKTGLIAKTEGDLVIAGTKGYIYAKAPWWLTSGFEIRGEDPSKTEITECEYKGAGLCYETEVFCDLIEGKGYEDIRLLEAESIARAGIMEGFLERRSKSRVPGMDLKKINIWGHRGASYACPENTIPAFVAAAKLPGIKGIETDIQRTADGQIVVFHDETLDRVMENGSGRLCDHTLDELKGMKMKGTEDQDARIPTLSEFLEAMRPYCENNGLLLNIELKTTVVRYDGIEREAYDIVKEKGMEKYIVWSSFLADSICIIKETDQTAETGMLGCDIIDVVSAGDAAGCDDYHPCDEGMGSVLADEHERLRASCKAVRSWTGAEPLFADREKRRLPSYDRRNLAYWGVTDIFTNVPERYLG